jgi:hypothetical protein
MALSASGPGTSVRDQGSSGAEAGGGPIALTVLAMRCHTGPWGEHGGGHRFILLVGRAGNLT